MRNVLLTSLLIILLLSVWHPVEAADQAFSVGYGFGLGSSGHSLGRVSEGYYNFVVASYSYEKPISPKWLITAGPFLSYVTNPTDGMDVGINLELKVYPFSRDRSGFYITAGTGGAYSTLGFVEQGTHAFFILQGAAGYRYKNFFIEDRYRHYSNGGTSWPNQSINANIISIGMFF
ncbi:MAG TPA: acyloxyacyl hydrolase [Syntrophorhabdales bacterium]|nr:acyloxyacyl hydrolase [Syntrophorhabdales bacterium]